MTGVSIVTTLYRSAAFVRPFHERATASARGLADDWEIVFVDDGSPDESARLVREIMARDPRVRLVELTRNFGHHKALLAGLAHARKDFVFLIDSDLEEPPELLGEFYRQLVAQPELDVVYGQTNGRRGGPFERLSGSLFYWLINVLSDVPVPKNVTIARLMRRAYVDDLLRFDEAHVFILGLMQLAGHRQLGVPVHKAHKGSTTYTLRKKLSQASDAVLSFSDKPLWLISLVGVVISGIAFVLIVTLIVRKLAFGHVMIGWT